MCDTQHFIDNVL